MNSDKDYEIIQQLNEHYSLSQLYYMEQIEAQLDDFKVYSGKAIEEDIVRKRKNDRRPTIQINKTKPLTKQVINNFVVNMPSITVISKQAKDYKMAQLYEGITKGIEYESNAKDVYTLAVENMVIAGRGFARITTEFENENEMNQVIRIKPVNRPYLVFMDPNTNEVDGSDAEFCIILTPISKKDFKKKYPEADPTSACFDSMFEYLHNDFDKNVLMIAEYYYTEYEEVETYQLENGNIIDKKDYENSQLDLPIAKKRKISKRKVKYCKSNGKEILESTEWAGKYIPIVPFNGDREITQDGKTYYRGLVGDAKQAQAAYNLMLSNMVEMIGIQNKSSYIMYDGQQEGHEKMWSKAHINNFPYLLVKPITDANNQTLPLPQKQDYSANLSMLTNALQISGQDMKDAVGIQDVMLGKDNPQEESGLSVAMKQRRSELGNSHFPDNANRAICYIGKQIIDLIPKIYDTKRVISLYGDDKREIEEVTINDPLNEESPMVNLNNNFGIEVSVGPYGETQKQQAVKSITSLINANPELAPVLGDILASNLEFKGSKIVEARMKKMLPDNMKEDSDKTIPPEIQQQIQEQEQQYQAQMAQMQDQTEKLTMLVADLTAQLNKTKNELIDKRGEMSLKKYEIDKKFQQALIVAGMKEDGQDKRKLADFAITEANKEIQAPEMSSEKMDDEYILTGVNDPVTQGQNGKDNQNGQDNQDGQNGEDDLVTDSPDDLVAKRTGLNSTLEKTSDKIFRDQA